MHYEGTAATALLGLPGFVLLAVSEHDGELECAVETTETVTGCPVCGVLARLHDRRRVDVRDLPSAGRPVTVVWIKRVWRCMESDCSTRTWTETNTAIRSRASMTERARREACRRVGEDGETVARVAAQYGVGWQAIMTAVREYGTPLVEDPARVHGVARLGVDETAFLAATATTATRFVTGVVDMTRIASGGSARLLDVVDGRSAKALRDWVSERHDAWRDGVEVAALDPFRGYGAALADSLPAAVRVLDAFHVTRLGFAALDDVRRRVQHQSTGHRGRRDDPLYRIRRVLRRRADHLSDKAWARLLAALDAADVDQQIGLAWIAAQELCRLYQCRSRYAAEQHLHRWLTHCANAEVPELRRLARTLDSWRAELLAYFDTAGASNGPTEAMNAIIKKIKRVGHGYRNLDNYRLRLLLHCGVDCTLNNQHESEAGHHA